MKIFNPWMKAASLAGDPDVNDAKRRRFLRRRRENQTGQHRYRLFRSETDTGKERVMSGNEAFRANRDFTLEYSDQLDENVPDAALSEWRLVERNVAPPPTAA